ncbi:MAG: DegT/DnrJ/EryC1/StrS family aminotransferase [Planctomycetes bacterium]|nr:DegT/DnrJ/EryC1/StrS family aminotransferase [Planctomycetota bacterium]MBU4397746.1 DegT/DnrJ/EryC1/StrS family aminotransferase [Planctomycetota bacterium]MCG2684226.1 DegT/DnrJ/EryC1/StrS family aminotransferase [Planctomycetales bacterium]
MWSRKRLDIGWKDLLAGVFHVCFPPVPASVCRRVEALWPAAEQTLACLSVRSGLDLLLGALVLPRGSEVLVSAITIPDVIRIVEHHGLVPAPVDLAPEATAPSIDQWRRAINPATKAILVAHLFGGRVDMEPILDLAQRHGLLVFEDCAQAFAGTTYQGHPRADASMFSFGVIKSSTALGGAVLRVRDESVLERMRQRQTTYPLQSRWRYLQRLIKYAGMKLLACRPICGAFAHACRAIGFDYDRWVNRAARGFPGDALLTQIRRQPSAPLLAVLERRLRNYNVRRWQRHTEKGRTLANLLKKSVSCPGADTVPHTYWVFPVVVDAPKCLMEHLVRAGFDATQGQSLCVVPPPGDRPSSRAVVAEQLLANIIFLPFYPELTATESKRIAEIVLAGTNHKQPA